MNLNQYQDEVMSNFKPQRELTKEEAGVIDWTLGIAGEAGEIIDIIQHHIYHGQPFDRMELAKEIGDCLWYLTALCEELGMRVEDCMELNVAKLRYRHNGSFSFETSANKAQTEKSFKDTEEFKKLRKRFYDGRG